MSSIVTHIWPLALGRFGIIISSLLEVQFYEIIPLDLLNSGNWTRLKKRIPCKRNFYPLLTLAYSLAQQPDVGLELGLIHYASSIISTSGFLLLSCNFYHILYHLIPGYTLFFSAIMLLIWTLLGHISHHSLNLAYHAILRMYCFNLITSSLLIQRCVTEWLLDGNLDLILKQYNMTFQTYGQSIS